MTHQDDSSNEEVSHLADQIKAETATHAATMQKVAEQFVAAVAEGDAKKAMSFVSARYHDAHGRTAAKLLHDIERLIAVSSDRKGSCPRQVGVAVSGPHAASTVLVRYAGKVKGYHNDSLRKGTRPIGFTFEKAVHGGWSIASLADA